MATISAIEQENLVREGTHEYCKQCGGEGYVFPSMGNGVYLQATCGECDGEGVVAIDEELQDDDDV